MLFSVFQLIPIFLTFGVCAAFGYAAVTLRNVTEEKILAFSAGTVFGLGTYAALSYVLQLFVFQEIQNASICSVFILAAIFVIMAAKRKTHVIKKKLFTDKTAVFIYSIFFFLGLLLASKLLIVDQDGIYTGISTAFGDLPWHIGNTTAFAEQKIPLQNPIFGSEKLRYPFMINYLSASFFVLSKNLFLSFLAPFLFLFPAFFVLLYSFCSSLVLGSFSKKTGVISIVIFLFTAPMFGFVRWIADAKNSDSIFSFLLHLPGADLINSQNGGIYQFLSPITSLLLPQRSFLFGLATALCILLFLKKEKNKTALLLAGILSGILPLIHAYSIIALLIPILYLLRKHPPKNWLWYFIPTLCIGIPEILFYRNSPERSDTFFGLISGWMNGDHNILIFWSANIGIFFLLCLCSLFLKKQNTLKAFAIFGLVFFILGNSVRLAPWEWDNMKILIYFYIFCLPGTAYVLTKLLERKNKYASVSVYVSMTLISLTGLLSLWQILLPTASEWIEWETEEIAVGKIISEKTFPEDIILSGQIHNSPVMLSGRSMYLGYEGHLWSHGINYAEHKKAAENFFLTGENFFPGSAPDYVLVGPEEKKYVPAILNTIKEKIFSTENYTLYKL